jgi:hypothetical protein
MVYFSSKPNSELTTEPASEFNSGASAELGMQSSSAKPQLEAFADVERLYSRSNWSEALDAGQVLLANLQVGATNSLRLRLELLIGHTLLYGFGKQAEAEPHYRVVQQRSGDPVLLAIASQGLQLCSGFAAESPVEPLQLAARQASSFPPQDGSGAAAGAASHLPAVFPPLPSALAAALEPAGPSPLSPALEPGSHAKPWLQQTAGDNFSAANTTAAHTTAANSTAANSLAASTTVRDPQFAPTPFTNAEFSNSELGNSDLSHSDLGNSEFANAEFDGNELDGSGFDGAAFPGIGGAGAALFPWQDSHDPGAFNPATTHAAPAVASGQSLGQPQLFPAAEPANELAAVPAPVRLKVTVASAWAAGDQAQPALSAAEMAELAKGLLELVLE